MSELTGDPVLDYLEELFDFIDKYRGVRLYFPPNFAMYPEEDQRVWIRNIDTLTVINLIPLSTLNTSSQLKNPKRPECISCFLEGGPRPPITS